MLNQTSLLLFLSVMLIMPLHVSGMVEERAPQHRSHPVDPTSSPRDSTVQKSSRESTGGDKIDDRGVQESHPPQQPPETPETLLHFLRDRLDAYPAADRFAIDRQGQLLHFTEPLHGTVLDPEQGLGTMKRLRGMLANAGLGALNDQDILRNLVPNQEGPSRKIGEDPLTRKRLTQIIDLIENHFYPFGDVLDQKYFFAQDTFEWSLRSIRGKGLVKGDQVGNSPEIGHLDGVWMIARIAEGQIEFPLHHPELSEYSLRELRYALVFALHQNMEAIDEKIASLKAGKEQPKSFDRQKAILFLGKYKKSIAGTIDILHAIPEQREDGEENREEAIDSLHAIPEQREVNAAFAIINKFHECFSLHSQSLEALEVGNIQGARYLSHQAVARRLATWEETRPNSRSNIIDACNESFELFRQAVEAQGERGFFDVFRTRRDLYLAEYFNDQAFVRMLAIVEATMEHPRPNIIDAYNESFELFRQAVEAQRTGNIDRAQYLRNQAHVRRLATEEESREHPRPNIIDAYNESFELFRQAVAAEAVGDGRRAIYLNNQAIVHRMATEEEFSEHPRPNIIAGYNESFERLRQAVEARDIGDFERAWHLNNEAAALYQATIEAAREEP